MNDKQYNENITHVVNEVEQDGSDDLIDDSPSELGSYAHSWHCNIAMACYDSMREALDEVPHEQARIIANTAATRFMKICFGVETKNI